jgi:molecular chaperone GrpE
MSERNEGEPKKVRVVDKRGQQSGSGGDPSRTGLQTVSESPSREGSPPSAAGPGPASESGDDPSRTGLQTVSESPSREGPPPFAGRPDDSVGRVEADLEEARNQLLRTQADFDNYRKRMLREQTQMAARASERLISKLLPVLDNFERAISHGEGGSGVQLVYKELRNALEQEGLEEIDAEGKAFDPNVHEALSVIEGPNAKESTVHEVHQRGYRLRDRVLRPAMVVVAQPAREDAEERADDVEEG